MLRLIDLPDEVRWKLEKLALKQKKSLKKFIEDLLVELVNKKP